MSKLLLDLSDATFQKLKKASVTAGSSLSPVERFKTEAQALTAENRRRAEADALEKAAKAIEGDGIYDSSDMECQAGRPMTAQQIITRLRSICRRLRPVKSNSDATKIGLYLYDGVSNLSDPNPDYHGLKFLFGFEAGISPEFSVKHVKTTQYLDKDTGTYKERKEFVKETRGWRTVLARLIRERIISPDAAIKAFGLPSRGSKNWKTMTT